MKKLFLMCCFAIGASTVSFAQGGGGGFRATPDQQIETLKTQITGLTDDQTTKLKAVYTVYDKTRDSTMAAAQNGGGDMTAMRASFMKMQTTLYTKVKAVLTADQATAYQKTVIDPMNERMKQYQQGGN
jgi:protein CpxP